jgi:predicted esterase
MCRRFKIARKRTYIGGFSGGARVASILGVAYADIYSGTLCVCGVNFYKNVRDAKGLYYTATYTPDPNVLSLARKGGRFVLLTGEKDINRENTNAVLEHGFKPSGFSHVLYLEVPGMQHAIPGAGDLKTALEFLDPAEDASK